jgi:hypothetical protein
MSYLSFCSFLHLFIIVYVDNQKNKKSSTLKMIPMLPLCNSQAMLMPMNPGMMGVSPAMVPMMPITGPPFLCPPNNFNMCSTTSTMNEYDSQMYGRFRHVEREHPRYRHAPFDWYRPPKQRHNIIHEDAAVVTLDGPVPIGDFYRYYIYGDDDGGDYDDDYDEYDDDDSASFASEGYDDTGEPSYEPRSVGYRRYPQRDQDLDDEDIDNRLPSAGARNYTTLTPNRRPTNPSGTGRSAAYRGTRTAAGDDDFDDARSDNSTYGN